MRCQGRCMALPGGVMAQSGGRCPPPCGCALGRAGTARRLFPHVRPTVRSKPSEGLISTTVFTERGVAFRSGLDAVAGRARLAGFHPWRHGAERRAVPALRDESNEAHALLRDSAPSKARQKLLVFIA